MHFEFSINETGKISRSIFNGNGEQIPVFKAVSLFAEEAYNASSEDLKDPVIRESIHDQGRDLYLEAEANAFSVWATGRGMLIKAELLPAEVQESLVNRGHSVLAIQNMSAEEIAEEHFNWIGCINSGRIFLHQCNAIQAVSDMFTTPQQ